MKQSWLSKSMKEDVMKQEEVIDREFSKNDALVNEDNGKVELQTGLEIAAQSARDKGDNESDVNPQALSQEGNFDGWMYLLDLLLQA